MVEEDVEEGRPLRGTEEDFKGSLRGDQVRQSRRGGRGGGGGRGVGARGEWREEEVESF